MGKIDTKTKQYVSRPDIFADLFNYLLYDGKEVVRPENLTEMDTTELALPYGMDGTHQTVQKYRDSLKNAVIMEDEDAAYLLILGIENQTDIHYGMPVRNMLYDAMNYSAQVSKVSKRNRQRKNTSTSAEYLSGIRKHDAIVPVVTLVVYFGQELWDAPMSLHEMLSTQKKEILNYVPNYQINLLSPVSMTVEEIDKFRSDFKDLAAFIRCAGDKDAMNTLVTTNERFKHLDFLTADIANDVTKSNLQLTRNEKGEVDMCKAIAGIREDGKVEGWAEGIFFTLAGLVRDGLLSISDAAVRVHMSEEEFAEKMKLEMQ